MKKQVSRYVFSIIASLLLAIIPSILYAGAGSVYNQIVFFGDSLSDNGNLYYYDYGVLPKSPPYFQGRFSNGYVWSERVAEYFYYKNVNATNYAFGGETAYLHNPFNSNLPWSLTASVDSYRTRTIFSDRSTTLFILWIGSNDYLDGGNDVSGVAKEAEKNHKTPDEVKAKIEERIDQITDGVIDSIKSNIQTLVNGGGMNFLIVNIPDLSKTPYAKEEVDAVAAYALSAFPERHNAKLVQMVAELANSNKAINIQTYDVNSVFTQIVNNPGEFNQKYQTHIANTASACWSGGYTLRGEHPVGDEGAMMLDIQNHLQSRAKNVTDANRAAFKNVNESELTRFIQSSPALMEAYTTTQGAADGTIVPCKDHDSYVFWDHIHPTMTVHKIMAQEMIGFIDKNFPVG